MKSRVVEERSVLVKRKKSWVRCRKFWWSECGGERSESMVSFRMLSIGYVMYLWL